MRINGYETTVGAPYRVMDKVENTLKTLHLTKGLTPTKKENVFVVNQLTEVQVDQFMFPLTLEGFNRKTITVYDERPYRNKNNQVTHPNEVVLQKLAAMLQQDVVEGNTTIIKSLRALATKGFAEAITYRLTRNGGLDINESLTLKILLAYFFVCLIERPQDDITFIATNVIHDLFGKDKNYIQGVIGELPQLSTLKDLIDAIKENPLLFKLKTLDLKDFIAVAGGISFSAFGTKLISAAAELPCFFMALVYATVTHKVYSKTILGSVLDPKYNRNLIESYVKTVEYNYPLGE